MHRRYEAIASKRGWPEITVDILDVTLRPSNKMRIMYGANLNFERFSRYFYDLLRNGFIEEMNGSDGPGKYKITEHGRTLLDTLRRTKQLLFSEKHPNHPID